MPFLGISVRFYVKFLERSLWDLRLPWTLNRTGISIAVPVHSLNLIAQLIVRFIASGIFEGWQNLHHTQTISILLIASRTLRDWAANS